MNENFDGLYEQIRKGEIERGDAVFLAANPGYLFQLADELRKEQKGDIVTYVSNRNINFTNVCVGNCKFCAFREEKEKGYLLSMDAVLSKVEEAVNNDATEICIQGGLHPDLTLPDYCRIVEEIKSNFDVHIHAFSPMEIHHVARNSGMSEEEVLKELKKAGLGSVPGTAAEILDDSIRRIICPKKIKTARWVEIIKTAHRLGIPTTSTILYGHIESLEDRIEHIFKIREIQKETGGFTEFVPLKFMRKNNELGRMVSREVSFLENATVHALSRVILHPYCVNVQASWVKLGVADAQRMLHFGVNDLGGTLMEESISRLSGSTAGEYMSPEDFKRVIKDAGRTPKRRDTLYKLL
ncbi:7,8-didemethyl-8-hydroxy-5-deazariboflavin synthase subunit CofH [Methanophagales archaeon]|nr:MAG: 7,8-didemethyl-8-hydroxy-5-deazariboflavin synthase subunit CofH [Methanophagales archaeon]RJS80643.1 MAG: 7,8-didemethyl-8-hydroxy-5-deazariboflavin synthase subunit CofH [Methanophagales archaeon]